LKETGVSVPEDYAAALLTQMHVKRIFSRMGRQKDRQNAVAGLERQFWIWTISLGLILLGVLIIVAVRGDL